MKINRFAGFTLAEVLITLGIIGVVAAMTMPTLINQTNGAQYKAAFKKSLSAISQAVTLSVAQDDLSFADTVGGETGSTEPGSDGPSVASLLKGKMNVIDVKRNGIYEEIPTYPAGVSGATSLFGDTFLYFNDGSMFGFPNSLPVGYECHWGTRICVGFLDVNGSKGPNKIVTCDTLANTKGDSTANGVITSDDTPCTVKTPTDIYPVYYYDQTIVPATNAGRAVLYGK